MRSALVLCLIALMADVCLAEDKKGPTVKTAMVRAEDLSSGKYQIEGRLGKPYGTILKIRGVWEGGRYEHPKVSPFSLRITEIDGKKLPPERQIVIDGNLVKWLKRRPEKEWHPGEGGPDKGKEPVSGEKVAGRVYESGGYVRHPEPVDELLNGPPRQDWFRFWFYSFVYFIDYSSEKERQGSAEGEKKPIEKGVASLRPTDEAKPVRPPRTTP